MAALAGGPARAKEAEPSGRAPRWAPPTHPVATTLLVLCFLYVLLFNLRSLGSEYMHPNPTGFPRPDEEKTDLNRFFEKAIPAQFLQFGSVTGLEQGWGVFAPRPARVIGYSYALATLANGDQVELMRGKERYEKYHLPPDLTHPKNYQLSFPNGRWRKWILNVPAKDMYPFVWIGHLQWLVKDWNATHTGEKRMVRLDIVFIRKDNLNPGDPPTPEIFVPVATWTEDPRVGAGK
jgi:hypothetical protein